MSDHFPPPGLKTVIHFLGEKIFQRKKEKKRGLISPQHSPTPTGRFGSLTPDNGMAWRKRSRGVKVWKGSAFSYGVSPPPHSLQSVWKISLQCVSVCELLAVRACTWSREEHARGQGSPHGLNRIRVLPLPKKARWALRLHRTTCTFHSSLPSFSVFSFVSRLPHFFSPLERRHNP